MGDEETKRQELRISPELVVVIIVGMAGFAGWLTNISYQVGSTKVMMENAIDGQEARLTAVEETTKDQESRLNALERAE